MNNNIYSIIFRSTMVLVYHCVEYGGILRKTDYFNNKVEKIRNIIIEWT